MAGITSTNSTTGGSGGSAGDSFRSYDEMERALFPNLHRQRRAAERDDDVARDLANNILKGFRKRLSS